MWFRNPQTITVVTTTVLGFLNRADPSDPLFNLYVTDWSAGKCSDNQDVRIIEVGLYIAPQTLLESTPRAKSHTAYKF